jgi:hypothetical protein
MQVGAIGDDLDLHLLALAAVELRHVDGIVERQVHLAWVILVNMNGDAMKFLGVCGERLARKNQGQCPGDKASTIHHPLLVQSQPVGTGPGGPLSSTTLPSGSVM